MQPAIRVENLSKCYRINHAAGARENYKTLRESVAGAIKAPFKRWSSNGNGSARNEDFWALKDVNFEIQPGEVVGIIGRNGAGKSTLLKILSRITKPTSGHVILHGRVGSLLEVGTGFHQELTGRENVYLNGSILGMSRREIDQQFDAIVDFSGVEKFLDTPVKRYSSGMQVRLAFAVAAYLDPELMLVDEVLAVGDQEFQKKCLGRMTEVSRSGRTIIFVSHNMAAVEALCSRCILLNAGRLLADADVSLALAQYHAMYEDPRTAQRDLTSHPGRSLRSDVRMLRVRISDASGQATSVVKMGEGLSIAVQFDATMRPIRPILGVVVKTQLGAPLFGVNNRFIPGYVAPNLMSKGEVSCCLRNPQLVSGCYMIDLYLGHEHGDVDVVQDAVAFEVTAADVFGSGKLPPPSAGSFYTPATWSFKEAAVDD